MQSAQREMVIEEKVREALKRDENKIVRALEIYYSRFRTENSITFTGASALAEANPACVVAYMFYKGNLGMPETRGEAVQYLEYLKNLRSYPVH